MKFNFLRMKKTVTLRRKFENKTINLLWNSLLSALTDIWEGTLKKENFKPQVFFWLTISVIYLIDTIVLQGFGFCIDDYEFIKQYRRLSTTNSEQGIEFTLFTIGMGIVCSYINLLLFIWMKHFDEPSDSVRMPGYNFSRSHRFIYYLILFFGLGYLGSFVMSILAYNTINLNNGILFGFGNFNNINFATPLRQMPECLIIMWSFLGFDFYLKSIKGQMEWRDQKEKLELGLKLESEKKINTTLELNRSKFEIEKLKVENDKLIAENDERKLKILKITKLLELSQAKKEVVNIDKQKLEESNRSKELLLEENILELKRLSVINENLKSEIQIRNIEVNKLEEENRAKDIQQRIFKSKFDAHLFINVLHSTYEKIQTIDEEAAKMILRLLNLFRYLLKLNSNESDIVPLSEDVEHILEYISLNRFTCMDKLDVYDSEITEQVRKENILKIERGILDEFITNAFKYASMDIIEGVNPFIRFKLSLEDDNCLVFCVENTTIIADMPKVNHLSLNSGLETVKDRLKYLYPDNHELEYGLVQGMGRFIIKLKIRLNYEK